MRCWQIALTDLNGSYIVGNLFICNTDSSVNCIMHIILQLKICFKKWLSLCVSGMRLHLTVERLGDRATDRPRSQKSEYYNLSQPSTYAVSQHQL